MKTGWREVSVREILQLEYGKPLDDSYRKPNGRFPVYGANGEKDRTDKFYYDKPSIIIGRKGSAGEINLTETKFWPLDVTYFVKFDEHQHDLRFIYYLLKTLELTKLAKGVKPGINRDEVYSLVTRVPPFAEQQRIVGILDETFDSIATVKANAEKNLINARDLFQSVLFQAVIGKTTKEWRETMRTGKTSADFDFKELLRQIAATDRKSGRTQDTTGHEAVTSIIPEEWRHTSIEQLFNLIDYRGKTALKSNVGRRLITARNIKMGFLSDEPVAFISEEQYKKWMVRGFPKPGDILFVTEGHTMGFVALNTRDDDFALAQRTITLQPPVPFNTKYFFYFMLSAHFQNLVKLNATGAAAVGMKASKFRSLPLAFPSFAEQSIIVDKLDTMDQETRHLNAIYQKKIAALDVLKKALLDQAFSGQL